MVGFNNLKKKKQENYLDVKFFSFILEIPHIMSIRFIQNLEASVKISNINFYLSF